MSGNYLLYDGDCPLCSRFVAMTRLRETLPSFHLIDARDNPQLVALHRSEGREIIPKLSKRDSDGEVPESACV